MIYRIKYLECEDCEGDHNEDLSLCMRDGKETILCEECYEKIDSSLSRQDIIDLKAEQAIDRWKDERAEYYDPKN